MAPFDKPLSWSRRFFQDEGFEEMFSRTEGENLKKNKHAHNQEETYVYMKCVYVDIHA